MFFEEYEAIIEDARYKLAPDWSLVYEVHEEKTVNSNWDVATTLRYFKPGDE